MRLLLMSGAKVDYRANTGEPFPRTTLCDEPLRLAIRNKHMEIARLLLEHGADPNKRYFFGSEINLVNDLEYLELLLTFGANPDSRDRAGLTPLMKAARQPQVRVCDSRLGRFKLTVVASGDGSGFVATPLRGRRECDSGRKARLSDGW